VVTAESGRVGVGLVSIQDATGGLAVHLPTGASAPERGAVLDVTGELAAPYGQLEVRPTASSWRIDGSDAGPVPVVLAGSLDETLEGLLVTITGIVATAPSGGGDVSFDVDVAGGARIRVLADATSAITPSAVQRGSRYQLTGVVGQRASASGRLDGYRIWLRDTDDIMLLLDPTPSPSASPSPGGTLKPTASPGPSTAPSKTPKPTPTGPAVVTIAAAIVAGGTVAVEGVVTAGSGLLDSSGRTIVVQDGSAAIQVRLPAGATARQGRLLRVVGKSGRSYGAPRILASSAADLGAGSAPTPLVLHGLPTAAVEWRLVRITGTVQSVHRSGKTWKADIAGEGGTYLVDGLEGANIPADRLRQGGTATITGIARRPRPNATERRYTVLPRTLGDVSVTGGTRSGATGADTSGPTPRPARQSIEHGTSAAGTATGPAMSLGARTPATAIDVDLIDLPASSGRLVRVGGLVTATSATGITMDDGTAVATATFEGDARSILPQLSVGLAVNLVGTAGAGPAPRLTVASEAGVVPVAAPGASSDAIDPASSGGVAMSSPAPDALASDEFGLSGAEEDAVPPGEGSAGGSAILIVGMLLSLALVGVVALLLRRGQPLRAMAHPLPGRRS
jgi:hypothetical protein